MHRILSGFSISATTTTQLSANRLIAWQILACLEEVNINNCKSLFSHNVRVARVQSPNSLPSPLYIEFEKIGRVQSMRKEVILDSLFSRRSSTPPYMERARESMAALNEVTRLPSSAKQQRKNEQVLRCLENVKHDGQFFSYAAFHNHFHNQF